VVLKSIFFWDMTPCSALLARWFAELFFDPEDGGDPFLRTVGYHSTHYTASYPRRRYFTSLQFIASAIIELQSKYSIFWDITPCSLLKVNRRFGGTCRLHLQGRRISQAEQMRQDPRNRRLTFNGLHGATNQKTEFLITTAVRTSNPT
jgi:hypothetical protein